jgi:hypothetical protein
MKSNFPCGFSHQNGPLKEDESKGDQHHKAAHFQAREEHPKEVAPSARCFKRRLYWLVTPYYIVLYSPTISVTRTVSSNSSLEEKKSKVQINNIDIEVLFYRQLLEPTNHVQRLQQQQ